MGASASVSELEDLINMTLTCSSDISLNPFPIEQFPDEILSLILAVVRSDSIKDFAAVLRVSRKWYNIGEDLVWRNVVLTRENLPHFVSTVQKWQHRSHLSQRIQSLTIEIGPGTSVHPQVFKKSVDQLGQLLPAMSSLKTFSFYNYPDMSDPWASSDVHNEFTTSLVRYLPSSVENLEINSPYIHFWRGSSNDNCLCNAISARIDGLRCLRLAYPRICSKLFLRSSSTLEYLAISPTKPDLAPCLRECPLADSYTRLPWDEVQVQKGFASKLAIRELLAKLRDETFIRERLPRIRQLNIIEPYHFKQLSTQQWLLLNSHVLLRDPDDLRLESQIMTESYPLWPTGFVIPGNHDPYHFILRRCLHSRSDEDLSHQCSSSDIVGYSVKICDALEGITGWVSDSNFCRRPRYLLPSSATKMLSDLTFLSREQWETRYAAHRAHRLSEVVSRKGLRVHPDEEKCDNWSEIKEFRQRYGVKPKEAGADFVWYVEDKLGHSALWGRTFESGFPQLAEDIDQSEFSSSLEALHEVQVDFDSRQQDDDDSPYPPAEIVQEYRAEPTLRNVMYRHRGSRISEIAERFLFGGGR